MTEQNIAGRVIIVTGGSSGIGRAICLDLAAAGAKVAGVGRRAEKGDAVVTEIRATGGEAITAAADVSDGVAVGRVSRWNTTSRSRPA